MRFFKPLETAVVVVLLAIGVLVNVKAASLAQLMVSVGNNVIPVTGTGTGLNVSIGSGTVAVANGGTGAATSAAFTAFGNFTSGTAAPGFSATPTLKLLNLAGTGTGTYRAAGQAPGSTPRTSSVVGTADTNFNCVSLGTLPANAISANGDTLRFRFDFASTAGTSTRTYTVNVGGTCAADATGFTGGYDLTPPFALPTTASVQWSLEASMVRQSAGNFRANSRYIGVQTSATGGAASNTGTLTESGTLSLGFAFKDSASAQNTLLTGWVYFEPAN